jgi:hypothetical protein
VTAIVLLAVSSGIGLAAGLAFFDRSLKLARRLGTLSV